MSVVSTAPSGLVRAVGARDRSRAWRRRVGAIHEPLGCPASGTYQRPPRCKMLARSFDRSGGWTRSAAWARGRGGGSGRVVSARSRRIRARSLESSARRPKRSRARARGRRVRCRRALTHRLQPQSRPQAGVRRPPAYSRAANDPSATPLPRRRAIAGGRRGTR